MCSALSIDNIKGLEDAARLGMSFLLSFHKYGRVS